MFTPSDLRHPRLARIATFTVGIGLSGLCHASSTEDVNARFSGVEQAELCTKLGASRVDLHQLTLPDFLPEAFTVELPLGGRTVVVDAIKTSVRSADFQLIVQTAPGVYEEHVPPAVHTYSIVHVGGVPVDPDSARGWLSLDDGRIDAALEWTEGGAEHGYEITPVSRALGARYGASYAHAIVSATQLVPSRGVCGVTGSAQPVPFTSEVLPPGQVVGTVAAVLDNCFVSMFTISPVDQAVINAEAVHIAENTAYGVAALDIRHVLACLIVDATSVSGCGTGLLDSQTTLNNLGTQWNSQFAARFPQVGDVHLFSGRVFTDYPVIGRAWIGGWCSTSNRYGVEDMGYPATVNGRAKLLAHERGHNWNASHCDGNPGCDIMNSTLSLLGPVGTFGASTISQMNGYKTGLSCVQIDPSPLTAFFLDPFNGPNSLHPRWEYALNAQIWANPINSSDNNVVLRNNYPSTTPVPFVAAELRSGPLDLGSTIPLMNNLEISFEMLASNARLLSSLQVQFLNELGAWESLPYLATTNLATSAATTPYAVTIPYDKLHYGEFRIRFLAQLIESSDSIYIDDVSVQFRPMATSSQNINAGYVLASGDVNHDGKDDLLIGNPLSNNGLGAVSVYLGASTSATSTVTGLLFEGFGSAIAVIRDVNADGFPDVAIGGGATPPSMVHGVVRVYSGAALSVTSSSYTPLYTIAGASLECLGAAIAALDDVDGDTVPDFAVGAPDALNGSSVRTGAVRVVSGLTGTIIASANIFGEVVNDRFGGTMDWVERADADAKRDLVVGMTYNTQLGTRPAYVKVYSGNLVGGVLPLIKREGSTSVTLPGVGDPQFGYCVSGTGDFNNDGWSDIAIGIPGTRRAFAGGPVVAGGHVLVRSASTSGTTNVLIPGEAYEGYFGHTLHRAGDLNKDGRGDFVVGAAYLDRFAQYGGAIYAMVGPNGLVSSVPGSEYYLMQYGMAANTWYGMRVAAGDYDGDGYSDIASSTGQGCTMSGCPNTTTIHKGHYNNAAYVPTARGTPAPGRNRAPTMHGFYNAFASGLCLDLGDSVEPVTAAWLAIGYATSTTVGAPLGIDIAVVPTSLVGITVDSQGRYTWSATVPTGAGLIYHQILLLTASGFSATNIVERNY